VISPLTLTWPSLMTGAINQNSSNHPTIINNTGNFNGFVAITAYDLKGETSSNEAIPASSFSVGANGLQCTSGITLTNSSVRSTGISSNPGNLSLGGGAGQANIYYCIPLVPSVSSQIYSTKTFGSWTVTYQ